MCGHRGLFVGQSDQALPDGPKATRGRRLRVKQIAAVALIVLAILGMHRVTLAQVPGPESFAQEPKTPMELWGAIDYLTRTAQAKKAIPYLEKFQKGEISDDNLIEIRDTFGAGSIMRLADDPATARYAEPIADKLMAAARRYTIEPARLGRSVAALAGTPAEQDHAVARLKEAGPAAVPAVIEALNRPEITPEVRSRLVRNLGRLDATAVPPLLAVLESGKPRLAADAATALGRIGDPRAIPFLTYPAASTEFAPEIREAAQAAISRLTGKPFQFEAPPPAQVLADAAWRFHRHQVEFPGDPVMVWSWDKEHGVPAARSMRRVDAESDFGQRLADQAITLQPENLDAQAVHLSLLLQKAIDRVGPDAFPAQDQATFDTAKKAGPVVLTQVMKKGIADGKDELAAAAASALGELTDPSMLARNGRPHPLVDALASPGSRVQLAAARALVNMSPTSPFPGSSRVVPALARFVTAQSPPRAIVIDSNPARGSQLVGSLRALGYETVMEPRGDLGFRAAADSADVELVVVSYALDRGNSWGLIDTLTNLKTDARTANLPVYVYGPLRLETDRPNLPLNFPGVKFLVQPMTPEILEKQIGGRPAKFSGLQRTHYAQEAAALLARIAQQPRSPLAADLNAAGPALFVGLNQPGTSLAASTALGDVPDANAQRSLADVALDPTRPDDLRRKSATQLAQSIKRFGPLVSADQEARLAQELGSQADQELRTALGKVVNGLRSWSQSRGNASVGVRTPSGGAISPGDAGTPRSPR